MTNDRDVTKMFMTDLTPLVHKHGEWLPWRNLTSTYDATVFRYDCKLRDRSPRCATLRWPVVLQSVVDLELFQCLILNRALLCRQLLQRPPAHSICMASTSQNLASGDLDLQQLSVTVLKRNRRSGRTVRLDCFNFSAVNCNFKLAGSDGYLQDSHGVQPICSGE